MSHIKHLIALAAVAVLLAGPQVATAGIHAVNLGTGAPGTTLDGYTMTPFGPDGNPDFTNVSSIPAPFGGTLGFSPAVNIRTVPGSWSTWSHGFTGRVYFNTSGASEVMTLPAGTGAFQFWAEPNNFGVFTVTATANDGTMLSEMIQGNAGASGFGFFADPGQSILSITVAADAGAAGFAVGELALARTIVPEPCTLALFGVGVVGVIGYARRRQK
jgi:hypothetical protein